MNGNKILSSKEDVLKKGIEVEEIIKTISLDCDDPNVFQESKPMTIRICKVSVEFICQDRNSLVITNTLDSIEYSIGYKIYWIE